MELEDGCLPCCCLCGAFVGLCAGSAWGLVSAPLSRPAARAALPAWLLLRGWWTVQAGLLGAAVAAPAGLFLHRNLRGQQSHAVPGGLFTIGAVSAGQSTAAAVAGVHAARWAAVFLRRWQLRRGVKPIPELLLGMEGRAIPSPLHQLLRRSPGRLVVGVAAAHGGLLAGGGALAVLDAKQPTAAAAGDAKGPLSLLQTAGAHFRTVCFPPET
eukprot:EG_transcript_25844